ncbi:MAG: TIGR03905 family TSCPD domain-containing protein [Rikenellaceae bacterium]
MLEKISCTPQGVCCRNIEIEIEQGVIKNVEFLGGCDGNLKGIKRLVEGQPAAAISKLLRGVDCRGRGTSCPDQLAIALENVKGE